MIFNYTAITRDSEINTNCPTSCNCYNSRYRYEPCGHVITGDLNIVKDREVIAFLKKGLKYRPASKINWKECRDVIEKPLRSYCKKRITKEISDKSCKKGLDIYIKKVMEIVDIRIKHYETNYKDTSTSNSISRIKRKLKYLYNEYVFVPADKAANNIVVV